MTRQTALVICPGRGSYQASELGYLQKHHQNQTDFIDQLDALRRNNNQTPISELDGAKRFVRSRHTNGEHASLLIYGCAVADYRAINQKKYEIVAIAGNSMGWYLSLTCAGALSIKNGAHLVNTMGTLMHQKGVGGQILYPIVNENWKVDRKKVKLIEAIIGEANDKGYRVSTSIHLGGTIVLAADKPGIKFLKSALPAFDRYPVELSYHAAFHSSLLDFMIPEAQAFLPQSLFCQASIPMIDGNGRIWQPKGADLQALYKYTLGDQINQPYNFTKSLEVGIKEFAPDKIIVLGPGTTMGPPVAQTIIANQWFGINSRANFKKRQDIDSVILSMGIDEQRALVV